MYKAPGSPCIDCGGPLPEQSDGRPRKRCLDCSPRTGRAPYLRPPQTCEQCGSEFKRSTQQRFCSVTCCAASNRGKPRGGRRIVSKGRHDRRTLDAPGLNGTQRRRLLATWRKQGRLCAYCDRLADTVDHVIPLARGGDSREGNLIPACRRCNAAKCDLLIVEWRHGRRTGSSVQHTWRPRPQRKRKPTPAVQTSMQVCPICSSLHAERGKTCGDPHCQREALGRHMRDRYREDHGLIGDPTEPTLYWIRLHNLPAGSRTRARAAA